jgi:hypothetical protein
MQHRDSTFIAYAVGVDWQTLACERVTYIPLHSSK